MPWIEVEHTNAYATGDFLDWTSGSGSGLNIDLLNPEEDPYVAVADFGGLPFETRGYLAMEFPPATWLAKLPPPRVIRIIRWMVRVRSDIPGTIELAFQDTTGLADSLQLIEAFTYETLVWNTTGVLSLPLGRIFTNVLRTSGTEVLGAAADVTGDESVAYVDEAFWEVFYVLDGNRRRKLCRRLCC